MFRQGMRLLVRPRAFFNQLQWSSHHWVILFIFLSVAAFETHVGKNHFLYQLAAEMMVKNWGVSQDFALWFVTSLRLFVLVAGSFLLSMFIWVIGNIFGRKTSQRVLFRRFAVVFTVFLTGYLLQHLQFEVFGFPLLSAVLYVWGISLGYLALREQFQLTHTETVIIGLFTLLMVMNTWDFANQVFETSVRRHSMGLSKRLQQSQLPPSTNVR